MFGVLAASGFYDHHHELARLAMAIAFCLAALTATTVVAILVHDSNAEKVAP